MPTSTLTPEDEKQNLNPGDNDYNRTFNDLAKAEEKADFDGIADNFDKNTADGSQEDKNIAKLNNQESDSATGGSNWQNNTTPEPEKKKFSWKKKGPIIGIGGGIGIVAIIFSGFIGPSLMLPSLSNMAFAKNDARGTILERRLSKVLDKKMSGTACASSKISCRMGKMPKSMLSAMKEKGITALNADGSEKKISGSGYVDENPVKYRFTGAGGEILEIEAAKFMKTYKTSPEFRKAFKSAYNMRFLGYNGKYMLNNFFKKLGINRDGGLANDSNVDESSINDEVDKKTKSLSSPEDETGTKNSLKERLKLLLDRTAEKTKKSGGDPILMTGAVACAAINLPTFVAGTYRAIQVAQVISLASDVIMSPGGMQQSGTAKAANISAIGKLLTDRKKNADGTLGKSALDSQILQSAIGVNKNKVGLSKYAPGYSLVSNGVVQGFGKVSGSTKSTCNLLLSPQAAIAVAGVEGAITVGTAGIGGAVILALKGIGKVALSFGLVEGAMKVAESSGALDYITTQGYNLVKGSLGNYVEGAHNEELGDALGVGMYAFFSRAGTASGGAVLKTSQVDDFSVAMASVDNEYRDEDIATLSPFDASSQYTFLGSIVSNLSLSSVQGNPIASSFSMLGHIITSPLSLFSKNSSADTSVSAATCSYGAELGLDDDIAVNPAGYPCVGIPTQYLDMSRDQVYDLVSDQIDEDTGEPKPGSDIALMMADCSEGDIESMSGCVIDSTAAASHSDTSCDDDGKNCVTSTYKSSATSADMRAAESIYMFDQQIENMLNGEDSEDIVTTEPVSINTTPQNNFFGSIASFFSAWVSGVSHG